MSILDRFRTLDLRARVSIALVGVLLPVFILLGVAAHVLVRPVLLREIEQIGVSSGKTLATEITTQKLLSRTERESLIESRVREFLYLQPNLRRIDVYAFDSERGKNRLVASSVEEDPEVVQFETTPITQITTRWVDGENSVDRGWDVWVPIYSNSGSREPVSMGAVRVFVSTQLLSRLTRSFSQIVLVGGAIGGVLLFVLLNIVLRRTLENEERLRKAEKTNRSLSEQLHETERELLNLEKFAVLGQLTASFAHEIGTPLNAIGGHLSLLKEELKEKTPVVEKSAERIEIVEGQVAKIAGIVRGFLESTSKPSSSPQLIDPHQVIEKTLSIVRPRLEALGIRVEKDFERAAGPLRIVPVHLEQVLINLVNNSLDSLRAKEQLHQQEGKIVKDLRLSTRLVREGEKEHFQVQVWDSGEGISAQDLPRVFEPFFTTKAPGEGTGLGLSICRDLMEKYGGRLSIQSKRGEWTEVRLGLPYRVDLAGETEEDRRPG